jgi:hypothetical protein
MIHKLKTYEDIILDRQVRELCQAVSDLQTVIETLTARIETLESS